MAKSKVVKLPVKREWKAGKPDLLRSDWPTWSRPPDNDIRYALRYLRARARHEAQNNDHARGFLREVKTNVIGHRGVKLQSKARMVSGRPDNRARNVLEDAWKRWGEVGECDVTGRLSWTDVQHQVVETVARDGEAALRFIPWDNEHRIAVQIIDPEMIDIDYNATMGDDRSIVMGVELDRWNRHLAYHVLAPDPQHRTYRGTRRRTTRTRIPAEQMVLIHMPEWMEQTRGVPWMATALRRMTDLEGYDESAVVAARAGAAKMGFYQLSEDARPMVTDEGPTEPGMVDGEESSGQLYQSFEPGGIGILPPGVSFEGWDPKYPHSEHGNFTKAVLRGIATGLGVSYNNLANDLEGVNYSSLRHGAIVERAVWMLIQEWLIGCFHQRVYREWLSVALGGQTLVDPRGRPLDAGRLREFQRVYWQARRWQWVDPQKEANAAKAEIDMRSRSLSSVIRERGDDPDEVWEEIASDHARLDALGIAPADAAAAITEIDDDD